MYNILYYDPEYFSIEEISTIFDSLKEKIPEKTVALPKGTKLVPYFEADELEKLKGVYW